MLHKRHFFSLRKKFMAPLVITLATMITLSSFYFSHEYKHTLLRAFEQSANKTAEFTSFAIARALEEHRFEFIKRIFAGATIDTNVVFIVLFDEDETQFAVYNPKSIAIPQQLAAANEVFALFDEKYIIVKSDVFSGDRGEILAHLVLAYSFTGLQTQLAIFRSALVLFSVISFLTGYLIINFISKRITNSIHQLQKRMQAIIDTGSYSGHIDIPSDDEVGLMAQNFVAMMQEIQKRHEQIRQSELNLKKVNAKLEKINRLKTALVNDASHQLRTPLTVIVGEAEVALGQKNDDKSCREALIIISEEAGRLGKTVDNLLSLAQADAGNLVYMQKGVDFSDLCWQQVELAKRQAAVKNIDIKWEIDDNCILTGDPNRLNELMGNLLENAIKYTKEAGEVSLALQNCGQFAILSIRDNGRGILPEDMDQIFSRFYRGKNVSKSEDGTGLGLAICRSIIDAHAGEINFTSTVGEGTEVEVKLNLEKNTRSEILQ